MDFKKELEKLSKKGEYVTTKSLLKYLTGLQKKIDKEIENAYKLGWRNSGRAIMKKMKEEE